MDSRAVKSNHSLVGALAQLDIGEQSQDLINKLPNEMLRAILRRVETHHLIRIRSMNKRWKALIEDICREKKCLVIMSDWDKVCLSETSRQLNGHFKLSNDFVFINAQNNYPMHLSSQLFTQLPKLFSRIEQFHFIQYFSYSSTEFNSMLGQWSSSLSSLFIGLRHSEDVNDLCAQINQLTNLKQLHLDSKRVSFEQLAPTLAQVGHLSGSCYESIDEIVPYLGEGFSSLGSICCPVTSKDNQITNWHNLNAQSVSNLVRFGLKMGNPQILSFICNHFSSLQMLHILASSCNYQFTANTIEQLAQLSNLIDFQMDFLHIDLASLDGANLRPLRNIRILSLAYFQFVNGQHQVSSNNMPEYAVRFCRHLATIFPNVESLIIKNFDYPQFGNLLEPHLNLFTNLRSHDFGFY